MLSQQKQNAAPPCRLEAAKRGDFLYSCFLLHHPDQFAQPQAQGVGDAPERVHIGVFGACFDHGQVAAGHAGQAGQHLLGQVLADAQAADDSPGDFAVVRDHGIFPFSRLIDFRLHQRACFFCEFCEGKNVAALCLRTQTAARCRCGMLSSVSKHFHDEPEKRRKK